MTFNINETHCSFPPSQRTISVLHEVNNSQVQRHAMKNHGNKSGAVQGFDRRFSLQGSNQGSPSARRANNLGIGYAKRHQERRSSAMTLETAQCNDGKHMMLKGEDGRMHEVEIVSTREHESIFSQNCPVLPLVVAILCGLLNLVPGLGTFIAALCNLCCHGRHPHYNCPKTFLIQIGTALLQLILAPLILGFFWSWWYAILMVQKSRQPESGGLV